MEDVYEILASGCIPQIFLEGANPFYHHKTAIGLNKEHIKFNTNLKESFFWKKLSCGQNGELTYLLIRIVDMS